MIKKITTGFVIQTFTDKGNLLEQEFIAGDQVDYEDENGEPLNQTDLPYCYHPFDMKN